VYVTGRELLLNRISGRLSASPAVALLGPRQCGKTTLARFIAAEKQSTYVDLENPVDLERLSQPMIALEPLRGLIVIDEIQQASESSERMPRAFHPPCDRRSRICGSIGYSSFTQDRRVTPWRTR
jgi:predicted AAA+ superfamily ATPase